MDWISINGLRRQTSIIRHLRNLNINESSRPPNTQSFDMWTFRSNFLQQIFKPYQYSQIHSPKQYAQTSSPAGVGQRGQRRCVGQGDQKQEVVQFTILLPTQYQYLSIFFTISVDISKQYIRYVSYPIKCLQMLELSSQQIIVLSRFFSYQLNSRVALGCVSVDPQTGCLTHQLLNNSLGFLKRRILKVPQELTSFILGEVNQIQKIWRNVLPNILGLLHMPENKVQSHSFWRAFREKRCGSVQEDLTLLLQYVKQSLVQFPGMFDQTLGEPRRIRSRFLSREEKAKKYNQLRSKMDVLNFNSLKFSREVSAVLELYIGKQIVKQESEFASRLIPPEKMKQVCALLVVDKYESRTPILTRIAIRQIRKEYQLSSSNFSQLKILYVMGQKIEDPAYSLQYIVSKSTQPCRFLNQTEILKFIGAGKSLFVTRYFFSQALPQHILLQYCPQKSIDAYLATHKTFVSFQTKIFFLYEIAVGLRFLRDYGVTHNDLKPQNVLLKIVGDRIRNRSATFLTKLIDLGQSFSKYQRDLLSNNRYRRGFTLPYAPPQQVKYQKYSQKTDVFSFGVMLYQFIFDIFPLQVLNKKKEVYVSESHYLKLYAVAPERCQASSFPKITMLIYHLVLRCIHPDIVNRPSVDWLVIIMKSILGLAQKLASF